MSLTEPLLKFYKAILGGPRILTKAGVETSPEGHTVSHFGKCGSWLSNHYTCAVDQVPPRSPRTYALKLSQG